MARPKKTIKDLPRGWDAKVIELMSHGASAVEVRAELRISQSLWDRLSKEEGEFSITIKKAKELCEAWWLRQGRENLQNSKFSPTLWYMNMKNRFGWRDRQETNLRTDGESLGVIYLPPKVPLPDERV